MHDHAASPTADLPAPVAPSLNRLARQATTHCLTGCAIGEIAGLVVSTQLGWSNAASIVLATVLAFVFGYSLTLAPLVSSGVALRAALLIAFAADTVSIIVMEIVDNLTVIVVPGAMDVRITDALFWVTLIAGLAIAWVVAFPVNRWLLARGQGHARVMEHHRH